MAVSGISVAVLFIFMQLGFYGAVSGTAVAVSSRLDAEVFLVSNRYLHLGDTETIPRSRLYEALAVAGVESATPLYARYADWRAPNGERCSMYALAFPLNERLALALPELPAQLGRLNEPRGILVDTVTQPKCGPADVGREVQVRERMATVVGRFTMGVGFLGDGALIMSDQTFSDLFPGRSLDDVQLGLVKLRPGADAASVARHLLESLPPDTRVLTRGDLEEIQQRYWVRDTSIGNIFALGTVVGFLVGTMILYQVLSTDIRTQLPQYATLKAIGYADHQIYTMVLRQSWAFGLLGFPPGFLLSLALYAVAREATLLPISMSAARALLVLLLSLAMCTVSGLFTLRRIVRADPAELF
ncbi:MAG TPA: FtsX-like permease family protein [Vicinamibacteria bacterium]